MMKVGRRSQYQWLGCMDVDGIYVSVGISVKW